MSIISNSISRFFGSSASSESSDNLENVIPTDCICNRDGNRFVRIKISKDESGKISFISLLKKRENISAGSTENTDNDEIGVALELNTRNDGIYNVAFIDLAEGKKKHVKCLAIERRNGSQQTQQILIVGARKLEGKGSFTNAVIQNAVRVETGKFGKDGSFINGKFQENVGYGKVNKEIRGVITDGASRINYQKETFDNGVEEVFVRKDIRSRCVTTTYSAGAGKISTETNAGKSIRVELLYNGRTIVVSNCKVDAQIDRANSQAKRIVRVAESDGAKLKLTSPDGSWEFEGGCGIVLDGNRLNINGINGKVIKTQEDGTREVFEGSFDENWILHGDDVTYTRETPSKIKVDGKSKFTFCGRCEHGVAKKYSTADSQANSCRIMIDDKLYSPDFSNGGYLLCGREIQTCVLSELNFSLLNMTSDESVASMVSVGSDQKLQG